MDDLNITVDGLNKKKRLIILNYLKWSGVEIHEHKDGCRVNLDKLTNDQQAELKALIRALSVINPINRIE